MLVWYIPVINAERHVEQTGVVTNALVNRVPFLVNRSTCGVAIENKSGRSVKLYWVSYGGKLKLYAKLAPGATHQQNSFANNTWLITDENEEPRGYFIVGLEKSRAVIPK